MNIHLVDFGPLFDKNEKNINFYDPLLECNHSFDKHRGVDSKPTWLKHLKIIIIIWFGDTVTVTHPTKCNTNSKVRAMSS